MKKTTLGVTLRYAVLALTLCALTTPAFAQADLGQWITRAPLPIARQAIPHAVRDGKKLCYLAVLDEERARVAWQAVGPEHPCAGMRGSDNLVAVYTDRYVETPLVVRGPGAGPEVTAAGVFGDVLRAAAEL